MPTQEISPSATGDSGLFYLPFMHPGLAGAGLPDEVRFLNPGLTRDSATARVHAPAALPLFGRSAERFLADLLAEGESLGADALSLAWPGRDALTAPLRGGMSAAERRALAAFTASAQYIPQYIPQYTPDKGEINAGQADGLLQAQKLLLLAYELEEAVLSTRALGEVVSGHERALQDLLHSDNDAEAEIALSATNATGFGDDILERCLSRWLEILRCWQHFLPGETVFYTADLAVLPGLDAGSAVPLAADKSVELFPSLANSGRNFVQVWLDTEKAPVLLVSEVAAL